MRPNRTRPGATADPVTNTIRHDPVSIERASRAERIVAEALPGTVPAAPTKSATDEEDARGARRRQVPEDPDTWKRELPMPWADRLLARDNRYVLRADPGVEVFRSSETTLSTVHDNPEVHRLLVAVGLRR